MSVIDMQDRELLRLAAKALGMPSLCDANGVFGAWIGEPETGHWWNPLEDDGDALRMAVALGMTVSSCITYFKASTIPLTLAGIFVREEMLNQPCESACRRAIVRAAAEIGKQMPC